MITEHEIIIPLENGGSLRCCAGDYYMWGGSARICDAEGNEIIMWDCTEFEDDAESVLGAMFVFSQRSVPELLEVLNRTQVVDGCWV